MDLTITVENVFLALTGWGLGTCWVGSFDEKKSSLCSRFQATTLL
ncbi:hypothetical protein E2P42_02720 [Candidatus Bathyarchaeota archaeon]|nr:hypothetical protein E2P42_02720 [Candidatus Bathyarchaeota archaeon]